MTKNLGIKILSLIIAIFLWLQLNLTKSHRETIPINIKLENIPESLAIIKISPEQLELQMEGTGRDLLAYYIRKQDYLIDLSGSKVKYEDYTFDIDVSKLSNDNLKIISDVEQKKINITTDRIVKREVNIEFQFLDKESAKFFSDHKMIFEPKKIMLKGAETELEKISSLPTEPFSTKNFRDGKQTLQVISPENNNVELLTKSIDISYEEAFYVKKTIPLVPIIKPENFPFDFTPKYVTIKVKGPPKIISELKKDDIYAYIDTANEIRKDTYPIKFIMPNKEILLLDFTPGNIKISQVPN